MRAVMEKALVHQNVNLFLNGLLSLDQLVKGLYFLLLDGVQTGFDLKQMFHINRLILLAQVHGGDVLE